MHAPFTVQSVVQDLGPGVQLSALPSSPGLL